MEWPAPVEHVASALRAAAVDARLEEFPEPTATAADAAKAVGCEPGEIVKSLVAVCDGAAVLALVPGDRRVDAAKIARAAGAAEARLATRDEVVAATGFAPGAVAPVGLATPLRVLVDRGLFAWELVWVGAGSSRHVAGLSPRDLLRVTNGEPGDLVE